MLLSDKQMDDDGFKEKLRRILSDRGLVSHMNDTKWEALCAAMNDELPFPPAYQAKMVMEDEPDCPEIGCVPDYHGDWGTTPEVLLGIFIEWVRISPRYLNRRAQPRSRIEDCSDELRLILKRLRLPYVEEDGFFTIYGHASGIHFDAM